MRPLLPVLGCLLIVGCAKEPSEIATTGNPAAGAASSTAPGGDSGAALGSRGGVGADQGNADPAPVPINSGVVALNSKNSMIQFVGTHAGGNPNPRTGVFMEFEGSADVDPASKSLKAVSVTIQTSSLLTPFPDLTTHLKSNDFFDVREHPTATFQSTCIDGSGNDAKISGKLSILGTTKEIAIPASVDISDQGLTLNGKLTIDRAEFGMDRLQDRVNKEVELAVFIGRPTRPPQDAGGFGGGRSGPGRGIAGGFDPSAMFKRVDADGDGKLTGDEIPNRMRDNLAAIDKDGDGSITFEEFQARMRQTFGGGRGGPGRANEGGGQTQRPERPGTN